MSESYNLNFSSKRKYLKYANLEYLIEKRISYNYIFS